MARVAPYRRGTSSAGSRCRSVFAAPQETLRTIATSGVVRQFPKQTVLINEGDVGDSLYIILSGRVKVYASNEAGREVVINFCGPGEYVGEMSLYGAPRSASVITVEPTSCAIVNRAQFRDFIVANPDFAQHLIQTLIHRARDATENVKSLALSDVYGRLVRLLNTLAVERDGSIDSAREAHAAGHRRSGRRVARHDRQVDEGPRRRRLPARRGSPDHDRQEAAARLVASDPASGRPLRRSNSAVRRKIPQRRARLLRVGARAPPRKVFSTPAARREVVRSGEAP